MIRFKIIFVSFVCFLLGVLILSCFHADKQKKAEEQYVDESERLKDSINEWNDKALEAYQEGSYNEAIHYFELCKKEYERNKVTDEDYGVVLAYLSLCYSSIGDNANAILIGNKNLEITKEAVGENHPDYATLLSNLSAFYYNLGDYEKAMELGLKALEIRKEVLGEKHIDYANSLYRIAKCYSAKSEYVIAIELCTQALEIIKGTLGEKNHQYATLLSNLAEYYSDLGEYQMAINLCTQALEITKKVFGENHPEYAITLSNLASFYSDYGNYEKAVDLDIQALKIKNERLGTRNDSYNTTLCNLASCYFHLGDYSKAIELSNQVLRIRKELFGEKHPSFIQTLNNLAYFYNHIGDNVKASELANKALEVGIELFDDSDPHVALLLSNLAGYYSDFGKNEKATMCFRRNIAILHSTILQQFGGLIGSLRATYWSKYSPAFTDWYPFFAFKSSSQVADVYDKSALFAKGLLLTTEIEMNKLIQESGDEEALSMFEEVRQKRMMLQKLYEKPIAERFINTDSLEQETDKLESELVKRSQVYGDFSRKLRTTWKDVQAVLDKDEIAVEFLSLHVSDDSTMVVALTLRKDDKEPKMIPLFEQKQLEKVKDVKISNDRGVRKTKTFYSQEVTDLVWKPMAEELKGIKRIYFSAAGILHKVGIEYAPGMEDYDMYRLSTTREIIDMKEAEGSQSLTAKSKTVLYGGVDYGTSTTSNATKAKGKKDKKLGDDTERSISVDLHRMFIDSLDVRGRTLKYLPGTLTEVNNISTCFDKKNCYVFPGKKATETSVKSLPENKPKILHIATHGFYYTESEEKRFMARRNLFLMDERNDGQRYEDKALSRSGLFMAGASKSLKGEELPMEEDDGILTAQEIAKIDLRGVDLVVLSACETGQGDINQGEGVFGLQRGFKKAGVQTILMSLWKVSDKATEMLMTEFYKQVCAGLSKRAALRVAQNKVREYKNQEGKQQFEDPFFWAGFILLD